MRSAAACAGAVLIAFGAIAVARSDEPTSAFLIPMGAEWRYHAAPTPPDPRWLRPDYDDTQWRTGRAGFGYGDDDDRTILTDMKGGYDSVYLRGEFHLPAVPEKLHLHVRYDDAFLAYVNGRLAARVGVARGRVVGDHEAERREVFAVSTAALKPRRNVIAVHGRNVDRDMSDFTLHPALSSVRIPAEIVLGESARRDLAFLRHKLLTQSSYLHKSDHNVIGALDAVVRQLPEAMRRIDLLRGVQRIIALLGDGHAFAGAWFEDEGAKYLPFRIADTGTAVLAIGGGSSERAFVEPSYPFITAIDGVAVDDWVAAAARHFAYASPQLNRRRTVRALRRVDKLREDLGLARSEDIIVTLAGSHGSVTRSFSLTDQRPRSIRSVVIGESRILSDNVGYLRIPAMEIDRIPEILEFMDEARNTDALIIDVRGNGGGRLEILRALAPYFLPPDAPPIVTNIAACRLASHFRPDHLADRPTFRLDHPDWTEVERAIIRVAQEEFRPAWTLPPGQFSEWHFMLINRQSDRTRRVYHYDRPVAVLSDAHALSATDGFLNGFCEIPGTHLVGQPSSGASGRMRSFTLPESDIEVGISSEV